jgi:Predicted dehydrogenases and related proteins
MHNVLIIGMGGIAYTYDEKLSSKFCYSHYRAFKNNKFFKVIGCVENNTSRKNYLKNKTNIQVYKSINLVPKILKIDIVVISTPTKNHLTSVKQCIKQIKPKVILCEKPYG